MRACPGLSILLAAIITAGFATPSWADSPFEKLERSVVNKGAKHPAKRLTALAGGADTEPKVPSKDILERLKVSESIDPETTDLLGERIDFNTGSVSFSHTDISIPGNFPIEVAVKRQFRQKAFAGYRSLEFEDWQLQIPHVHTTLLRGGGKYSGAWGQGRPCSGSINPGQWVNSGGDLYEDYQYWNGDSLNVGGANEKLLKLWDATYKRGTASNWRIKCESIEGGATEAFLAESPDGTKYRFAHLRLVSVPPTMKWDSRFQAFMQVTEISDRFGNAVHYKYENGNLKCIVASDNRAILLNYEAAYNGGTRIKDAAPGVAPSGTATACASIQVNAAQRWSYRYETLVASLKEVERPDGRFWLMGLSDIGIREPLTEAPDACQSAMPINEVVGSLVHPNGARGEFKLKETRHGRTEVPSMLSPTGDQLYPKCFYTMSVISKTLTGPGLPTMNWSYAYSWNAGAHAGETKEVDPTLSHLPHSGLAHGDLKQTMVTSPDGSKTRHVFSRRWNETDGTEVATEIFDVDGSSRQKLALKTVAQQMQSGNPLVLGVSGLRFENVSTSEYRVLTTKDVVTQGSDTYTTLNTGFNEYGAITQTEESNSFSSDSRQRRLGFQHDTTNYVLNLPTTVELLVGGAWTVVSEKSYHPSSGAFKSQLAAEKRFSSVIKTFDDYDANGNLKQVTYAGANNITHKFDSYHRGKPRTLSVPARYGNGTVSAFLSVNDDGTVSKVTDFNGNVTRFGYDGLRRLTSIDPADATWADTTITYSQTANGPQVERSQAGATLTRRTQFDSLMRPTLITDVVSSNPVRYQKKSWNAYNKPVFVSQLSDSNNPASGTTTTYDGLQRVKTVSDGSGTTTTSYLAGNKVQVQNPRGYSTTTTFLAYGSPEQSLPTKIESPESLTTDMSYDVFGNLLSVTQGGYTETRLYDARKYLCKIIRPEMGQRLFNNNALGMVNWYAEGRGGSTSSCEESTTDGKVTLTYDNQGDLWKEDYQDATPDREYTRDGQGNLTKLVSGSVVWDYVYNSANLLSSQTLSLDGKTFALTQGYNSLGQVTSLTYPNGGGTVDYAPNAFGQPTKAGTYASSAQYHPNGLLKSFTYGNGYSYNLTLDSEQRPDVLSYNGGGGLKVGLDHGYDANDNLSSLYVTGVSSYSQTNSFDGLDRLTGVTGVPWGNASYLYDNRNNLTKHVDGSKTYDFTLDASRNRLSNVSNAATASIGYDIRGNVTGNGRHNFSYGLDNRMATATGAGISDREMFFYDGHGRLVKKILNGGMHYSVYGMDGTLHYQVDADGTTTRYIRLGKQPVAEIRKTP